MAKSGRIIIALGGALRDGTTLCSSRGSKLAKVMEIIGPVSRPFASAIPLTNNISPHIGKRVFALDEPRTERRRRPARQGGRRR